MQTVATGTTAVASVTGVFIAKNVRAAEVSHQYISRHRAQDQPRDGLNKLIYTRSNVNPVSNAHAVSATLVGFQQSFELFEFRVWALRSLVQCSKASNQ